ncbi:hypothetical protein HK104_002732, partial [Borealophlyctis nickersoniae]
LPPDRIIFVVPPLSLPSTCFDNSVVDEKVQKLLDTLGITVHRDSKLLHWDEDQGSLSGITIKNKQTRTQTTLPNIALFLYADTKSVAPDTFRCINDSCLVFDGRLVVDKYFRTQDPFIVVNDSGGEIRYAAGSITKYSSKYQTRWSHELCDSKEVGRKLAELLMPLFDPTCVPLELQDTTDLMRFEEAKKIEATLPGDLYYFHFDRPRLPSHSLEWRQKQNGYGRDLIAQPPIEDPDCYFRIHVAPDGRIHSLTYIGRRRAPADNLLCLYGLHEKYLNRLVARFDEGVIVDFLSFLNEPWALPLYHDRFTDFSRQLRSEMLSTANEEVDDIVETLMDHIQRGVPLPQEEAEDLYKAFDNAPSRKVWDKRVFEFLLGCEISKNV